MASPFIPEYYLFITTNGINLGTGVTGTNSNFSCAVSNIPLDPRYNWLIQLQQLVYAPDYSSSPIRTPIVPVVLCDQVTSNYNNNTRVNILYKGNQPSQEVSSAYVIDSYTTNVPIFARLNVTNMIDTIAIQIVSNIDGSAFAFAASSFVTMTLAVYKVEKEAPKKS